MDSENINLKQRGQKTISIFPAHPYFQVFNTTIPVDPAKQGYNKQLGVYVKAKKDKDRIIGYQILNDLSIDGHLNVQMHDAQNLGDVMSESFRSIHYSTRNVLNNLVKLMNNLQEQKK